MRGRGNIKTWIKEEMGNEKEMRDEKGEKKVMNRTWNE